MRLLYEKRNFSIMLQGCHIFGIQNMIYTVHTKHRFWYGVGIDVLWGTATDFCSILLASVLLILWKRRIMYKFQFIGTLKVVLSSTHPKDNLALLHQKFQLQKYVQTWWRSMRNYQWNCAMHHATATNFYLWQFSFPRLGVSTLWQRYELFWHGVF